MKRYAALTLLLLSAMTAIGCSASLVVGNALLPEGIEEAQIPDVRLGGYLCVSADPSISLSTNRFAVGGPTTEESPVTVPPFVDLSAATLVIGTSTDQIGATLKLASVQDAENAWLLYERSGDRPDTWGKIEVPRVLVVRGAGSRARSARGALEADGLVLLRDRDPVAWATITNLPENPPSRPVAVGMLKMDEMLIESLVGKVGIWLNGMSRAFTFLNVETIGLGLYADEQITVSGRTGTNMLKDLGAGVLVIAESGYPGFAVSFMLGVVSVRIGMEMIELGDTEVRSRTKDDLHLMIANKGKILFSALAGSKEATENLMLNTDCRLMSLTRGVPDRTSAVETA